MANKPNIRFKGFTEDWEQRKLEDYIVEYHEVTTKNNQYPALTSSRKGIFLQTEYFAGNQIASEDNTGYNIVPYGYFTYRHMSDDEIFHFNINDIVENGIVSTLYPVFTTTNELDSRYLQYQLNHGHEFAKFAVLQKQGGSRTYMYLSKLKQLSLTMPKSVDEQKQISGFFMKLDHLITLHQRKCDDTKKLKKYMLQKMFPKNGEKKLEIRFAGFTDDWEQRKFGDVAVRESSISASTSDIPSVEYEDVVAEEGRLNKDIRLKEVVKSGIIFDGSQVLYGKLRPYLHNWLNPDFNGIAVGDWWVLKPINMDKNFLYRLIQTQQFDNIANQSSGSKMPRADWNLISNSEFMVSFSKEEQRKIGGYFDNLDHLITLHQRKCDDLKSLKKYMLQNMFV